MSCLYGMLCGLVILKLTYLATCDLCGHEIIVKTSLGDTIKVNGSLQIECNIQPIYSK